MPTNPCLSEPKQIAQTLFLGASVASYSTNAGWGSQPSQITVNLIEDEVAPTCLPERNGNPTAQTYNQFANSSFDDDHYHACTGINCYIDKYTGQQADDNTPVENRILPGKVYYFLDSGTGTLKSRYWRKPDPGFFGNSTKLDGDGADQTANATTYKYDIIDTPVYFKMGDFTFGGFVQSWSRNLNSGGKQYSVIVNGPSAILKSCYIIVDKFAGAIFSRAAGSPMYGTPKNYTGVNTNITYDNTHLKRGILPNVFNVYGFLESFGTNNFGGSGKNENGISINYILDALSVLTSIAPGTTQGLWAIGTTLPRTAFSPFGRVISKCMMKDKADDDIYSNITSSFSSFGIIPPQATPTNIGAPSTEGGDRCQFVLDLNDLIYSDEARTIKRMPDDIRTTGPVMSIMDLIDLVAEKTGQDVFIEMVPSIINNVVTHIIKVKTISRLQQPRPNLIENTIKNMQCNGYYVSSNTFGKEKNETPARAMIIGGQQQRLYQVKSYRLAYSQSSFIYNPKTGTFINYRVYNQPNITPSSISRFNTTDQYGHGKVKCANFCTTRNKPLTDYLNTNYGFSYHDIVNDEDKVIGSTQNFTSGDSTWADTVETGSGLDCIYGNYSGAEKIKANAPTDSTKDRWIPLYMDTICPFFGFVNDSTATISVNTVSSESNTDHRRIRPVWLDSWTGQINVVIDINELPELNINLNRANLVGGSFNLPYTNPRPIQTGQKIYSKTGQLTSLPNSEYFYLTESEIRAALAGFDNFLVYSLAKTYKPDLIEMVRRAYFLKTKKKLTDLGVSDSEASAVADKETDWYWKLMGGNIGGDSLYPIPLSPDKNDGSQYIQEKALQDLKLLHKFVSEVGKYYGKKYMVTAWNLQSYKDESLFGASFTTSQGYGYVFSGDGKLIYNYTPTNDGAWEEYGNIIDDSIVVGSPEWYSITDEQGKIKPLLGYNNNYNFDHVRYAKCRIANSTNFADINNEWNQTKANPYFSFNTWLTLQEAKTTNCSDTYIFPSLDTSSLGSSDYIVIDQKGRLTTTVGMVSTSLGTFAGLVSSDNLTSYNAWGEQLNSRDSAGSTVPLPKSKLYVPTTVEEDYVFLDPINREYAKILIEAPGLQHYLSSEENAKDPNRTVIANVAAEDLIVYLKTTQVYDYEWIRYMLSYIVPMSPSQTILGGDIMYGTLAASSNTTANNVELAPKAAHPFFAAIPIKSNVFVYGPWTNYPGVLGTGIFPDSTTIDQNTTTSPATCTPTSVSTDLIKAEKAINNTITATEIEVQEDFVPWNYGGMYSLDIAAFKEIETKINYQTIIETAQVEMPGLPLFNLGGCFIYDNIALNYQPLTTRNIRYTQTDSTPSVLVDLRFAGGGITYDPNSVGTNIFSYDTVDLRQSANYTQGPIISTIQTSIGQQGISTTYTFRTYTRKIGLFNKEENDRMKRLAKINMQRNKQIANIHVQMQNIKQQQLKFMTDERLNKAEFGSADLSSKLYGWSPSMVIIGQARPYIEEPLRNPKYIEDFTLNSNPGNLNSQPGTPTAWRVPYGRDEGDDKNEKQGFLTTSNNDTFLKSTGRITSTVQLYERKEVNGQLDKDYGMQSAMSLDGLLSPISFYPTDRNATFNYSLHDKARCPFCKGTKIRKIEVAHYNENGTKSRETINITCDKCTYLNKKLNAILNVEDSDVPINLITLNPIVVPKGEFKNSNSQSYSGAHPDKLHKDLSKVGGHANQTRYFYDRLRHCIEIVARGSVPQSKAGYALETSRNVNEASNNITTDKYNLDYHNEDIMLSHMRSKYGDNINNAIVHETNQRFIGLRGPLVLHSWGYDQDGYPVPNAADEPFQFDSYGRPMRFKIKINYKPTAKKYKSLSVGDAFTVGTSTEINAKTFNKQYLPSGVGDTTDVYPAEVTNDLTVNGGFDPAQGYTGDIIGKTQNWNGSRWSEKVTTNDFYLNWAERPDLWKVGPIDLVWDEERKVWTGGGGGDELMPPYVMTNSNDISSLDDFLKKRKKKKAAYQHIYATLEEDLIKQTDFDETYATRAFIDDIEYSKDPLLSGYRRLIYIKDKCGYTAPRGTKLLCRYNRITGFYEPISKPVIMAKGSIAGSNKATIELHYVQGRRSSTVPTVLMDYTNPMAFTTNIGSVGMFTFINGMWTLISIK